MPPVVEDENVLYKDLSKEDQDWYNEECKRVNKTIGYQLNRRQSGVSALKLWLIAEKDYDPIEAANLSHMPAEQLKNLFQEFFMSICNPEKTVKDNMKNLGRIHKKAMDKLNEIEIPKAEEFNSIEDFNRIKNTIENLKLMQIDYSQDMEFSKDFPNDMSLKTAYYEGAGGRAELEKLNTTFSAYLQGFPSVFSHMFGNGKFGEDEKAIAYDLSKDFLRKYGGKKMKEMPLNVGGVYIAATGQIIMQHATFTGGDPNVESKKLEPYKKYINGESDTYPGKDTILTELAEVEKTVDSINDDAIKDDLEKMCINTVDMALSEVPEFDLNTENLLNLSDETQEALEEAYYKTFGTFYRNLCVTPMYERGLDEYDFIIIANGSSVRDETKKNVPDFDSLSPALQEKAMALETMRQIIKNPEGVKASWLTYKEDKMVPALGVDIKKDSSKLDLSNKNNVIKSIDALLNKQLKYILHENDMTELDCIFINDKSLSEIFEERFKDDYPNAEIQKKIEVMSGVLMEESLKPNALIFATNITVKSGMIERYVIPLPVDVNVIGKDVPHYNREQIVEKGKEVLAARNALNADPEKLKEDVLRRADESVNRTENKNALNQNDAKFAALDLRMTILEPASRELYIRTREVMDELNRDGAVDYAEHMYRVYDRAANLAENKAVKSELREKAESFKNSPALVKYNKYMQCMEYAYALDGNDKEKHIPLELHEFFENETGMTVPEFARAGDLSGLANYRPTELTLSLGSNDNTKYIDKVINEVYVVGQNLYNKKDDVNEYILIGGRTLKEILSNRLGNRYRENFAGKERAGIIADALNNGTPVDFFVVGEKKTDTANVSSVPIHIVSEGFRYEDLNPKKLKEQKKAYKKIETEKRKFDGPNETAIKRRNARLEEHAARDYESFIDTAAMNATDKDLGSLLPAMQKKYFPNGMPKANVSKLDKLPEEEKNLRSDLLRVMRFIPINYVLLKLAEESMKLKNEGNPGYSLDEIFSLNKLEEQKNKYASEFVKICDDYDLDNYHKTLMNGAKALMQLHTLENPWDKAVISDEAMKKAFLGKNLYVVSALIDAKQELGLRGADQVQIDAKLVKDKEEVQDFQIQMADYYTVGKNVSDYVIESRKAASGKSDIADDLSFLEIYDATKAKIRDNLIKGNRPSKGLFEYSADVNSLCTNDMIEAVPLLNNAVNKDIENTLDNIANGTFLDTLDMDHEALNSASEENIADAIKVITPYKKRSKEISEMNLYHKNAFMNRIDKTREEMHNMSSDTADALYDKVFGPMFDRPEIQAYLKDNPQMDQFSFFRVGGLLFKDWAAKQGDNVNLKEQAIKAITDSQIPFGYVEIVADPVKGTLDLGNTNFVYDSADMTMIMRQNPMLHDMETFKEKFKKRNNINTSNFTETDWKELYDAEIRITTENGLIPEDRVITKSDLSNDLDSSDPQEIALNSITTLFGAKQFMVDSWMESNNTVYDLDLFRGNMKDLDAGDFSNKEFAVLAYFVSMDPNVISVDPMPEVAPEDLPHEQRVQYRLSGWTTDFKARDLDMPRGGMCDQWLSKVITPVREITSDMIREIENNKFERIADSLSKGIKQYLGDIRIQNDFEKATGDAAHMCYMLKNLTNIIKRYPELEMAVGNKLTQEEKRHLRVFLRLKERMDDCEAAKAMLERYERGEIELSNDDRNRLASDIDIFNSFAARWKKNMDTFTASSEYVANAISMMKQKEVYVKTKNEGKKLSIEIKFNYFTRDKYKLDEELLNDILDDDKLYKKAEEYQENIDKVRDYFMDNIRKFFAADEKIKAEMVDGNYVVEPKEALSNKQELVAARTRFENGRRIIASALTKEQILKIGERYNKIAAKKGWSLFEDKKGYSNLRLINQIFLVSGGNKELLETFYDYLFEEIRKTPGVLNDNVESIVNYVLPTELSLNEMKEVPKDIDKEIEALKTKNPDEVLLLDEIKDSMAQTKENVRNFIFEYSSSDHAGTIVYEQGKKSIEHFKDGKYNNRTQSKDVGQDLYKYDVMSPEQYMQYKEFVDEGFNMSSGVETKVSDIVKRMKEYGMIGGNLSIEQGAKIYGYQKLVDAKESLKKAVKSGDMEQIRKCNDSYNKEVQHMREIHQMVKDIYDEDNIFAPGNVDTVRNENIPPEFSTDYLTDSRMNGIFQLAETAESLGVTVEEYIHNPTKCIMDKIEDNIRKNGFNVLAKADGSFLGSLNKLYSDGLDEIRTYKFYLGLGGTPDMIVSRTMDSIIYLDDKNKHMYNEQYKLILSMYIEEAMRREVAYISSIPYLLDSSDDLIGGKEREAELREGLKRAFLDGGAIEKKHLPMPLTTDDGLVVENIANYDKMLKIPERYKELTAYYNASIAAAEDFKKNRAEELKNNPDAENVNKEKIDQYGKQIIVETMFDYLMAHPEDMDRTEYKEFEKTAFGAAKKLGVVYEKGVKSHAEKYKEWKRDLTAEIEKRGRECVNKDKALNRELKNIIKEISVLSMGVKDLSGKKRTELSYKFNQLINERIEELRTGRDYKEITKSYVDKRINQLRALKNDHTSPIENPPKFIDKTDSLMYKQDISLMNDIVQGKVWGGHLSTKEKYISWRLSQDENLVRADLSEEEWENSYKHAIYSQDIERNSEEIENEISEQLGELENEISEEFLDELTGSNEKAEKMPVLGDENRVDNPSEKCQDFINALPGKLHNDIGKLKMPNGVGHIVEMELLEAVAAPIVLDILTKKDGIIPNGKGAKEFVGRIARNKNFAKVVKPYLDSVYLEYVDRMDNPDKQNDIADYNSVKTLISDLKTHKLAKNAAKEIVPSANEKKDRNNSMMVQNANHDTIQTRPRSKTIVSKNNTMKK